MIEITPCGQRGRSRGASNSSAMITREISAAPDDQMAGKLRKRRSLSQGPARGGGLVRMPSVIALVA